MVTPVIGSVVAVTFPFSDLSASKLRPALVLADSGREDWICVQITSKSWADSSALVIRDNDFLAGSLKRISYARPGKLFTANQTLFRQIEGQLTHEKLASIRAAVIQLIHQG